MRNIERHGFSMASAAIEYTYEKNLPPQINWKAADHIAFGKWLVEESPKGSLHIGSDTKVNHPSHYKHRSGHDAIFWIDRYNMNFETGNSFKYLFRRGEKMFESQEDDEQKAKWYFIHEANRLVNIANLSWEDAKRRVADILIMGFGPPGTISDGQGHLVEDWTTGGCDNPSAIDFIKKELLPLKQF